MGEALLGGGGGLMIKINIVLIFILIVVFLAQDANGGGAALRLPMDKITPERAIQAKFQVLMEKIVERELPGDEAFQYMLNEKSNFILALILEEDSIKTYFYPKRKININHINSGKAKVLKLKEGCGRNGRGYVLAVSAEDEREIFPLESFGERIKRLLLNVGDGLGAINQIIHHWDYGFEYTMLGNLMQDNAIVSMFPSIFEDTRLRMDSVYAQAYETETLKPEKCSLFIKELDDSIKIIGDKIRHIRSWSDEELVEAIVSNPFVSKQGMSREELSRFLRQEIESPDTAKEYVLSEIRRVMEKEFCGPIVKVLGKLTQIAEDIRMLPEIRSYLPAQTRTYL